MVGCDWKSWTFGTSKLGIRRLADLSEFGKSLHVCLNTFPQTVFALSGLLRVPSQTPLTWVEIVFQLELWNLQLTV